MAYSSSSHAAVVSLASNQGPVTIAGAEQYIAFNNPLSMDGDKQGSLFFGAVITRPSSSATFSTIGIYANNNNTSVAGAVDVGRNTAAAGFAAFDYLDNKGAGSGAAGVRTAGVPVINMDVGTYRMIGEIEFTSPTAGNIRAWITDGTTAIDMNSPNLVTTFTSGFTNDPATLYVKLNSTTNQNIVFSSIHANWAETSADRAAAFNAMVPEPSAVVLGAIGMLGFTLVRSRRQA